MGAAERGFPVAKTPIRATLIGCALATSGTASVPSSVHRGTLAGPSPDNLVRSDQERLGNGQAEGLGRFEVDHQLKFCRLLHGEVSRLRTLEDFVDVGGGALP